VRFEYCDVASLDEAVSLLGQYGDEAHVLAGGTDLLPMAKEERLSPRYLIDIKPIQGMGQITWDARTGMRIGALATIRDLERSPLVFDKAPAVARAAHLLGSVQIRNRATVGGNVCQAVPSAEMPPPLIALGAIARVFGPNGYRTIPLEELFTGPRRTSLHRQEIMTDLQVPEMDGNTGSAYLRFSPRKAMDLAIASAATMVRLEDGRCVDCRIVLGAVAPTPLRAIKAEESLKGERLEDGVIDRAAGLAAAEATPISDIRASAEYRRELVKVLVRRALLQSIRTDGVQ